MELNHNLIVTDDTKELINNAVANLLTNNKPSDTAGTSPLNRSTTVSWEHEDIERYQRDKLSITVDNCLLHLLDLMNQAAAELDGNLPSFDSLSITSMEDRTVRKEIRAPDPAVPLVLMHIGNDRALNIIPKKFSKDMMDVHNVTLSNFSTLVIARHTHQLMNLTLPYESTQYDGLDIHLLIIPFRNWKDVAGYESLKSHHEVNCEVEPENTSASDRKAPNTELPASPDLMSHQTPQKSQPTSAYNLESQPGSDLTNPNEQDPNNTVCTIRTDNDKSLDQESPETIKEHVDGSNTTQASDENEHEKTNGPDPMTPKCADDGATSASAESSTDAIKFLSTSSSIAIVNGITGKVLNKWLGELKIPTKKDAFENRQILLDFVQNVIENKVKPPGSFINKFVEKLDDDTIIDEEIKLLNITIPQKGNKALSTSKKKRIIKNFLIDQHHPSHDKDIGLDLNLSSLKRQPPPDLLSDGALSTSAMESRWSDSSKAIKPSKKPLPKKKKKKNKSRKPIKDDPPCEEPEVNASKTVPKENRELSTGTEINAAITGVNKLQNAFETLEESVVKLSQDHSRLEEGLTKEYSAQKRCLDLLLEEDSVGKRSLEKRIDQTLHKQLNPLMKRIQHLEASNRSLQEGFELHTKNLECILEKLSTINEIAKNNNTRIDLLHEDLLSTNRRQQEISRKLNLLKPPKTNSTVPRAEVELGALNENQHGRSHITPCMCRSKNTADRVSSSTQTESGAHAITEGYQQNTMAKKSPVEQPIMQDSYSSSRYGRQQHVSVYPRARYLHY